MDYNLFETVLAGWEAYHDPQPGDMWQEIMNYYFIIVDVFHSETSDEKVMKYRDVIRGRLSQKISDNEKYMDEEEFMRKITYNTRSKQYLNGEKEIPVYGKEDLMLTCIREFGSKDRSHVCRYCKINIPDADDIVIIDDNTNFYVHSRCLDAYSRITR